MKLIVFQNSLIDGVSGGNIRFIEIAKRLIDFKLYIVTSAIGRELNMRRGVKAEYIITSYEQEPNFILGIYAKRLLSTFGLNLALSPGDALYCTSDFLPDVLPAFYLKLRNSNIKWIQIIHHRYPSPFERKGGFLRSFLGYISQQISFALIRSRADIVLVYNSPEGLSIKNLFVKKGVDERKIMLIQNGVDLKFIQESVKNVAKEYDAVFVGRLSAFKGAFDLIKCWKIVCKEKSDAILVIVGTGSPSEELRIRNEIKKQDLEKNVVLAGYLEGKALYETIGKCKVGIHPSYEEGWGIVICEEMACGLPVVAWNLPVYRMIYPEGIIVAPVGDISALAEHVLNLLSSESLHNELSQKALKVVSNYDWDAIANHEREIIKK
jgi:glycosyltransferase involved in cell wall biosynthesis